jgi:hypothetical protein
MYPPKDWETLKREHCVISTENRVGKRPERFLGNHVHAENGWES